jgi:hypothetical protein
MRNWAAWQEPLCCRVFTPPPHHLLLTHCLAVTRCLQAKGGAFTGDEKDFFRFRLGEHSVIPGFEEAVAGMRVGGVRRVIVPEELGYPGNDYNKLGPKPTTFSGEPRGRQRWPMLGQLEQPTLTPCHCVSSCVRRQPVCSANMAACPPRKRTDRLATSLLHDCRAACAGLCAGQQGND